LDSAIPTLPDWAKAPLVSGPDDPSVEAIAPDAKRSAAANERLLKATQPARTWLGEHPKTSTALDTGVSIGQGVADTAQGLTSPANIALMIASPESKILSGLFAMQALHGSYKTAQEAKKAYMEGRNQDAIRLATQALLNAGIGTLAGTHALKGTPLGDKITADMKTLAKGGRESEHGFVENPFVRSEEGFVDPIKTWPQFKQWFGNSKVVDEAGKPKVLFHGTDQHFDEFTRGELGSHFGTAEQANKRLDSSIGKPRLGENIIPAYIRVNNPIRLSSDPGYFGRLSLLDQLVKDNAISAPESKELLDRMNESDKRFASTGSANERAERFKLIREYLKSKGYDGIVYPNEYEGTGESYIVFDPTQVKSAIGNSGAFDPKSGSLTDPRAPKLADVKAKAAELKPTTAYKSADQSQPFYLKSENLVSEKMKGPMPAEDVHKMLLSNGVKPEEMKWTGLDELLQGKGKNKVTPQEIQEHLAGNNLQVQEVVKGQPKPTQWTENRDGILTTPEGYKIERLEANGKYIATSSSGIRQPFDTVNEAKAKVDYWRKNSSEDEVTPKFSSYQLPGGQNYRELLITMPKKETVERPFEIKYDPDARPNESWIILKNGMRQGYASNSTDANAMADHMFGEGWRQKNPAQPENFRSGHWDEPNVLGHLRFNDRTGPNGEKILHVEELQSDWGQHIRSEGVKKSPAELAKLPMKANRENGFWEIYTGDGQFVGNVQDWDAPKVKTEEDAIKEARRRIVEEPHKTRIANKGLPDMPFKKTEDWAGLLFKRMMRHAAENGYDGISWTPGDEQVTRYPNLAEVTDRLMYDPKTETLRTFKYDNNEQQSFNIPKEKLSDHIGKEATQRLLNSPLEEGEHVLEGDGLITGGKGQRVFYDTMVPQIANKLGKQWGAKVGETKIEVPASWKEQHNEYVGPDRSLEDVEKLHQLANRSGRDIHRSPFTENEHMFAVNRVSVARAAEAVLSKMDSVPGGVPFKEAMTEEGTPELAEYFGGKLEVRGPKPKKTPVPYLPITPQMRAGVKSIPYSLFSIPLAAGALTLAQVKEKAQELQDKQKKTGATQ
jgi:hypothetical protein